jgi:hypothetical protein
MQIRTYLIIMLLLAPLAVTQLWAQQVVRICPGDTVKLQAHSEELTSYQWFKNDTPLTTGKQNIFKAYEPGIYKVIGYNTEGCSSDTSETITLMYQHPTAINDTFIVNTDLPVSISILENDTSHCSDFDTTTLFLSLLPIAGTAQIGINGVVIYTPNSSFTGIDSFKYSIRDIDGTISNIATTYMFVGLPLPLQHFDFYAYKKAEKALLHWQVQSGEIIISYEIERSKDSKHWYPLGIQIPQSEGYLSAPEDYYFEDQEPFNSDNYYRIKATMESGIHKYSIVRHLHFNTPSHITIYPNPTEDKLSIVSSLEKIKNIRLIGINGVVLLYKNNVDAKQLKLDLSAYASGSYYLHLTDASGQQHYFLIARK